MIPSENPETNEMPSRENIQPISMPESIVVHIENKKYVESEEATNYVKNYATGSTYIVKVEAYTKGGLIEKISISENS